MYSLSWVVKASKLCNLRCRYCYEWDDLDKKDRISLAQWEHLLVAMRTYHENQEVRLGEKVETRLIWHGGEPLILPLDYLEAVMELERKIFGRLLREGRIKNILQTNLYSVDDARIEFLKRECFSVGISFDYIPGVRLNLAGGPSEERIVTNIDRLREGGVEPGAIVVLAGHTCDRLTEIYDFFEEIELPFRILPLFAAPLNVPGASFAVSYGEMLESLSRLFSHWLEKGRSVQIAPLQEYFVGAILKMTGLKRPAWSRATHGDMVYIVNTDGTLYEVTGAYDKTKAFGNLFTDPLELILASKRYQNSLEESRSLVARHCTSCPYFGACNTAPLYEGRWNLPLHGRCAIAYDMMMMIERQVTELGFGPDTLNSLIIEPPVSTTVIV